MYLIASEDLYHVDGRNRFMSGKSRLGSNLESQTHKSSENAFDKLVNELPMKWDNIWDNIYRIIIAYAYY